MTRRLLMPLVLGAATLVFAAPPVAAGGDEEDEAIAEEALPTLDDLPAGWEEDPEDEDTEQSGLPECEGIDAANKSAVKQPNAESPNFLDGANPTAQVEARVFVFSSAKGAKKYFKAWNADAAEDCLIALGLSVAEEQEADADVAVETLGLEGIGDDVVGRSLILEVAGEGAVYLDFFVARVGRAVVGLGTQDIGGSLPEGLDLIELSADRLEEEL
ncbi:MAG: hypothetical protein ACT4PI_07105 [Actinomycetota bacterium]